jgi:uncharacterized protein YraI
MMASARTLLIVALLALGAGATWAAYAGVGASPLGTVSLRSGSVGGPGVVGGGPRYGK